MGKGESLWQRRYLSILHPDANPGNVMTVGDDGVHYDRSIVPSTTWSESHGHQT